MIRRVLQVSALTLLLALGIPTAASAHVLKVDGTIGAVLHINPDDNPTTGGPTNYVLSFDDDTGKFSLPKCLCSVTIINGGKVIADKKLAVSNGETSVDNYTFPTPAVYTMRFTGTPKHPGAFQPFVLDYEIRVTNGQSITQPIPTLLWVGLGMIVSLLLLAAYTMENRPTQTNERKKP